MNGVVFLGAYNPVTIESEICLHSYSYEVSDKKVIPSFSSSVTVCTYYRVSFRPLTKLSLMTKGFLYAPDLGDKFSSINSEILSS